jgi:pimeloyl-ACP methyl ester carboxylesterase
VSTGRVTGWLGIQVRRHPRLLRDLPAGLIVIGALAWTAEVARERAEARILTMPGELVDIGGRRLHLDCRGSGSPAVVLIPGAGETSAAWGWVAPPVAQVTRVCTFDRAGRGWSDAAPAPQDGNDLADELHTLLERGGVEGPVVLVGHSFGGLYLQAFAARHPAQVAGAVLLDSTHPQMFTRIRSYPVFYRGYRGVTGLLPGLARFGITRLVNRSAFDNLPPRARAAQQALWATPRHARSQRDEWAQAPAAMAQAAELHSLGERPLIVVTAGMGTMEGWLPLQVELAALSPNSLHRVVEGATHMALVDTEGAAAASTRAIEEVVLAVRSGRPLR